MEAAQRRFDERWSARTESAVRAWACPAHRCGALQAADYFLWALQRLYERGEDRYLGVPWPRFSLVVDTDDTREAEYGVYYTQKRPLDAAALEWRVGI